MFAVLSLSSFFVKQELFLVTSVTFPGQASPKGGLLFPAGHAHDTSYYPAHFGPRLVTKEFFVGLLKIINLRQQWKCFPNSLDLLRHSIWEILLFFV